MHLSVEINIVTSAIFIHNATKDAKISTPKPKKN